MNPRVKEQIIEKTATELIHELVDSTKIEGYCWQAIVEKKFLILLSRLGYEVKRSRRV